MTASCEKVRALSSAYLDGALTPRARGVVQDHLRRCPGCMTALKEERRFLNRVRAVAVVRGGAGPDPQDLAERVLQTVAARRQPLVRGLGRRLPFPWPWAAAVLAALALGWVLGTAFGPEPQARDVFDPAAFTRAVQGLTADLVVSDQLPSAERRALLESQVARFGLRDSARRLMERVPEREPLHGLAAFATRVADEVEREEPRWDALRSEALRVVPALRVVESAPWPSLPPLPPRGKPRTVPLVGLDAATRGVLEKFLATRDRWVFAGDGDGVRQVLEEVDRRGHSFSGSWSWSSSSASSSVTAGTNRAAEMLRQMLEQMGRN